MADASGGTLKLPVNGWISGHATAVALTLQAEALGNGTAASPAMSGGVTPGNLLGDRSARGWRGEPVTPEKAFHRLRRG